MLGIPSVVGGEVSNGYVFFYSYFESMLVFEKCYSSLAPKPISLDVGRGWTMTADSR